MASISDKITEVQNGGRPISTTVAGTRSSGSTTLSCAALTNWPTNTAVHFATYQVDTQNVKIASSQTDWKGTVSGTSIENLTVYGGTDNGNSFGDIVEMMPTGGWAQDLAEALEAGHTTTGVHKAFSESNIVTTASIQDNAVTPAKWVNNYVFLATMSAPTGSIAATTFTKVPFDTEAQDFASNYNPSNYRYTAPIAGVYEVSASLSTPSSFTAQHRGILTIRTNGTESRRLFDGFIGTGSAANSMAGAAHIYLNASDYIEIFQWCDTTGSGWGGSGGVQSFFSAALVSPQ